MPTEAVQGTRDAAESPVVPQVLRERRQVVRDVPYVAQQPAAHGPGGTDRQVR